MKMAIYYIFLPSCYCSWKGQQTNGRYLRSVAAGSKQQAVREFLSQIPGRAFWLTGSRCRTKVVARHEKKVGHRTRNKIAWLQGHAIEDGKRLYVEQYPLGWQIVRRLQPNLEMRRNPIVFGNFATWNEAEEFAFQAFGEKKWIEEQ
jgi:hypothetical protein